MKRRFICISFLLIFMSVYCKSQSLQTIFISEVFYDIPCDRSINTFETGEYIELYNAAKVAVDISGWKLKGDKDSLFYIFPTCTILKPSKVCLVVFQGLNNDNDLFDLFPEVPQKEDNLIVYQRNLIVKNNKDIALYNSQGFLIDSLEYSVIDDSLQNRKRTSNSFLSVGRKKATINICDNVNIDQNDFVAEKPTPLQANLEIVKQNGYAFGYDLSGNRISRSITVLSMKSLNEDEFSPDRMRKKQTSRSDQLTDHEIIIFPNPTKGKLLVKIRNHQLGERGKLIICGANGLQILEKDFETELVDVDLGNQLPGLYMMNIYIGEEVSAWKIIKE